MITDSHDNQILSRFELAASLQASAHHFDLKVALTEQDKQLNSMIATLLSKESRKLSDLGLSELQTRKDING